MKQAFASSWPLVLKVILPSFLTALGTVVSVVNSEMFRAFCGVQ